MKTAVHPFATISAMRARWSKLRGRSLARFSTGAYALCAMAAAPSERACA